MKMRRWQIRRLKRGLLYLGILVSGMLISAFALVFLLAGEIYEYTDTVDGVHLPPVDAVVCLAGGRGRIAAAGDIWYRYWELHHHPSDTIRGVEKGHTPVLYLSGLGQHTNWNTILRQFRRGVRDVIQPEDIIIERVSTNTEGNARFLQGVVAERKWDRIILMTSPYHMRRARFIFESIFRARETPLRIDTLSIFQEPFEPGEWRGDVRGIHVTMTEYLKWVWYQSFWKAKGQ